MGINELLELMASANASDIHLNVSDHPTLRIHGRLTPLQDRPRLNPELMTGFFAQVTSEGQREVFQKEKELDFSYSLPDIGRFRVNACQQKGCLSLTFRFLHTEIPSLEALGLPEVCKELVVKPRGLIMVTGPTGSGKSTTLGAMIEYLNQRERRRVITIEDPIEFLYESKQCVISQRELGNDTNSFAAAAKHALRQDPDVILVGEVRDTETAAAVLTAAETGHLVLTTSHAPSAPQAIDRVIDLFPPHLQSQARYRLSNVIESVMCQALIPRADGSGRVAAMEVMLGSGAVKNLIRDGKSHQLMNTIQMAFRQGMQTLDQTLALLCKDEIITLEEATLWCRNFEDMERFMNSSGENASFTSALR